MVSQAQNIPDNIWYFGNGTQGIAFDRNSNSPSLISGQATPFGTAGSTVVIDPQTGNLLFYTDGTNVYDATHRAMPGGALSGNTTGNQPSAAVQIPGQPNQFLVFTNSADFGAPGDIFASVVDMSLPGNNNTFLAPPLGDVTPGGSILTGRSEGMMVVRHDNGTDFWLISHEAGTGNFTATLIDASQTFPFTTYAVVPSSFEVANLSWHEASGKIGVAPQSANQNVLILDFNTLTGEITFDQAVPLSSDPSNETIYDTEWSSNGQYLYISRGANVLQFDTSDPTIALASVLQPPPTDIVRSLGLQMGPDSTLYQLYETSTGQFLLGGFTDTDSVASLVSYDPTFFASNPNFNGTQFPSFLPTTTQNIIVDFIAPNGCANTPLSFVPTVLTPRADSLRWDFGDGQSSNQWGPIYTYQDGGTFDVTLTAFLNGDSASVMRQSIIAPFDVQVNLVQDTAACSCSLPFPKNTATPPFPPDPAACQPFNLTAEATGGSGSLSYEWFGPAGFMNNDPGDPTLFPDSAGYYYVRVTDAAAGCSVYAAVNIREYGVEDQRANIWHFGNGAGIDFNPIFYETPGNPVGIPGPVSSQEGVSTVSDRNGQVVLTTDGNQVYDRDGNALLPDPPGLGGSPDATQSSIIVPVPGNETLYYIFTTQETFDDAGGYEFRYAIFDIKLGANGSLIDLDPSAPGLNPSLPLYSRSTERIASDGAWVISHEYGSNCFRAWQVSATGLSNPVVSCAGTDHSLALPESGHGYMKFVGQNLLGVALNTGSANLVELFDFDPATGIVSNPRTVDLNTTAGQVYGLEFSGNKIFATISDPATSFIYEILIDSLGNPTLLNPPITVNAHIGALQTGPDRQIHVAVNGSTELGMIQPNPDPNLPSTFNADGIDLAAGTTSSLGLPNFVQILGEPLQQPGIVVSGVCVNDSVSFSATPSDQSIDKYFWTITQNGTTITSSEEQNFSFMFTTPGTYEVDLLVYNDCGYQFPFTEIITVFPSPDEPDFLPPGSTNALGCPDPTLTLEAVLLPEPNLANLTFQWTTSPDDTLRTLTVSQPGTYGVTITDQNGCTSTGNTLVIVPNPIDLGPDRILCSTNPGTGITLSTPFTGSGNHVWTRNGLPIGNSGGSFFVDTSTPTSSGTYIATFTNPVNSCVSADTVLITINETPRFSVDGTDIACAGANGQITFTIDGPTGSTFLAIIQGAGFSASGLTTGVPVSTTSTLTIGAYPVVVTEELTACSATRTATIGSNEFTVPDLNQVGTCAPINILPQAPGFDNGNFTYRLINSATGEISDVSDPVLDNNVYFVEATRISDQCIGFSDSLRIDAGDNFLISFEPTNCTDVLEATAPGATSFDWTNTPDGIVDNSVTTNIVQIEPGTWPITVIASGGPGTCPTTGNITVTVDTPIPIDFSQSTGCANQVTLTATPALSGHSYNWFTGSTPGAPATNFISSGQQITARSNMNGFNYMVTVFNNRTVCPQSSAEKPVSISGPLNITSLTSTAACEGTPFDVTVVANRTDATFEWIVNNNPLTETSSILTGQTAAGTYRVTASAPDCPPVSAEATYSLAPVTRGNLFEEATICDAPSNTDPETNQVELNPGAGFESYNWFRNGRPLDITDPVFIATEGGTYSVELTNIFGCTSEDETEVLIECNPKITGPNAFRPDGFNREFFLFTFFISDENFQVFIFNRWGEIVYQSSDREFRWNGGYNNDASRPLPPGTYTYVIKYEALYLPELGTQQKRGGVVLMR